MLLLYIYTEVPSMQVPPNVLPTKMDDLGILPFVVYVPSGKLTVC